MSALGFNLLLSAAVTLVAVVLTFGIARRRNRYDTIDTLWGLGFALIAFSSFVVSGVAENANTPLRLVITVLTAVWGIRLAVHLHLRNRKQSEDPRYVQMIERAGGNPAAKIFVRVYLLQGVVMWFVSLPVQIGQFGDSFGPIAWLGIIVWLIGFGFETIGDYQLRVFKANPNNAGKVLDTGLWRYTRHPNYFGDACVWWGLFLLACSSWLGAATILSPALMTYTLARGTGKPLLEKGMQKTRPGYADYVQRTSGFFPLPPRNHSRGDR